MEPSANPVFFSPFHHGTASNVPLFDSPLHLIGESPVHNHGISDSPYHIPSSTESPLHGPDESPMYVPTSLADSVSLCIDKSDHVKLENSNSSETKATVKVKMAKQHRKRHSERNLTAHAKRRRVVGKFSNMGGGTCNESEATSGGVSGGGKRGNISTISRGGTGVDDNSENSEDSDYDTSDMEDGECGKKRRFCIHKMDTLSTHYDKFKLKFYTDKLTRLEHRIELLKSAKCPQYLAQIEREESKCNAKIKHADTVLKFQLKAAENAFKANKTALINETDEKIANFTSEVMSKLESRRNELKKLESLLIEHSSNEILFGRNLNSLHRIFNEMYPQPKPVDLDEIGGPYIVYQLTDKEIADDLRKMRGEDSRTRSGESASRLRKSDKSRKIGKKRKVANISQQNNKSTVLFNNLNIRTDIKLCVKQKGRKDFYGYASGVNMEGALIISSASKLPKSAAQVNDSSGQFRAVTLQQINNEEVFIKQASI